MMSRAGVLIGAPAFCILRYGHPLIVRAIMTFLSEAWCPSMGRERIRMSRAPGYWLYSYSTYVLRSIYLRVYWRPLEVSLEALLFMVNNAALPLVAPVVDGGQVGRSTKSLVGHYMVWI